MTSIFRLLILALTFGVVSFAAYAKVPAYTVDDHGVRIKGVGPNNPIIYDNDWWMDVFDAYYVWALHCQQEIDLRGNIVTRDMWDVPNYHYTMQQCVDDAVKALALVQQSIHCERGIPPITLGADRSLERPDSGRIEDTVPRESAGARLIITEARNASPEKPLVIIAGGPVTTIANALLLAPDIADRIIVFALSLHNFGYNGKDGWSAYIVAKKTYLVEWATGSFWERNSVLRTEHFQNLPDNPLCNEMRRFINTNLGQANQLGDGAPLVWLMDHRCWTGATVRKAEYHGPAVRFLPTDDGEGDILDIPKANSDLERMRAEFFRIMGNPALYKTE